AGPMEAVARRSGGPVPAPAVIASLLRARRLIQRNLLVYRHGWIIIVSGFFEPLFYLLGIGFGLGSLVQGIELADGRTIPFQAFVAPGLLAMSTMNGAIAESIFNVFFKLNFSRTYEGILATPLGIREIAIGELIWSLMRGGMYVIAFLGVMLALGLILSPWALLVLPAAILLGAAFSAAGLATTAYLRTVQDFDLPMGLVVMPMFLFSGTFFPVDVYPEPVRWIMEVTPLFHGTTLLRGLTTGLLELRMIWDLAYLIVFCGLCLWIAMRQMERKLIK
ncbi:MAG TPA: ABC transporter permease, partial [Candidatus Limnocylindria bacterium]|nr:ABC transporter permease [Candidatus Limnocylindria bacterium]